MNVAVGEVIKIWIINSQKNIKAILLVHWYKSSDFLKPLWELQGALVDLFHPEKEGKLSNVKLSVDSKFSN